MIRDKLPPEDLHWPDLLHGWATPGGVLFMLAAAFILVGVFAW